MKFVPFFSQNIHVCTVYTNLGDDAVVHALKETEVTTIVTSHELLPRFKQMLSSLPNIRTIVYLEDQLQKVSLYLFFKGTENRKEVSSVKLHEINQNKEIWQLVFGF